MTIDRLVRFRQVRRIYLQKGKVAFANKQDWEEYQALLREFHEWLTELNGPIKEIAEYYWLRVLPDWAVGMRTFYSERQIRRIRVKIYNQLREQEVIS